MSLFVSAWGLALAVTLAGCRGTGTAASPTAAAGAPTPVEQAEGLAEDVQTDVAQGAWPAAHGGAGQLKGLREKLDTVGVSPANQAAYARAVDSLNAAIARRSQSEALIAGNDVSRIVADIMVGYPSRVPVEVVFMDVAGRDLLYAAQQGRWSDAAAPVGELARDYASVQATVRARNFALDQVVTSELAQLRRAVASRAEGQATSLAQALLDDVDRIELLY